MSSRYKNQILMITSFALFVSTSVFGNNKLEYIFSIGGKSPSRVAYEAELIQSLLDVTKESWGAAKLILDHRQMSTLRTWKSVNIGKSGHLLTTSNWPGIIENGHDIIKVNHPIEKGLLGYRKCLVRKENIQHFKSIETIEQFKKILIGQAIGWRDITFYEQNKIKVIKSARFKNLLPMLGAARFDCLPLGILEVDDLNELVNGTHKNIVVFEDMLIIYKFSVYIGVSPFLPELAKRLSEGMEIVTSNGKFDQIFSKHFQSVIDDINNGKKNVFYLKTKTEKTPITNLIKTKNIHIIQPE